MIETDALVIGAGPVGLFQVFQLGLHEIKAHVIDTLSHPGGQCVELYGDKPIYDIPGLPVCTGQELAERLMQQIAPMGATFHWGQEVCVLHKQDDGRFYVETSQGTRFTSKTIFIAAGVGAFKPRTLQVPGVDRFAGRQLFYGVPTPALPAGTSVVVLGDSDAALEYALRLSEEHQVTLLHRRDVFQAEPATVERMRALCATRQMQFRVGQITGLDVVDDKLTGLQVTGPDALTQVLALDALVVFLGLSPKLGPLTQWGLDMERKQLKVDTEKFATSEPGIFAVGDINTYLGKKKLILCGFHESTLAAFGAVSFLYPDKHVLLQYTSSSPKLQKILGVSVGDTV